MKLPTTLGRYEVVDLIGQGGMGALYRARDPRIGRYVAIKQLRQGYDTAELRDRFRREAQAAGCLSHPNIVTIYDVDEHDGLPFIAMEYVRGETFADLVCLRPPLLLARKLQLTEEVCAGLAHAHEAGIVHRDIKPANLIVGPEGTVKILDFGIAKLSATGITVPGAIIGTLNYMSPEQVRGDAVDTRADIFAVGAVLYELLTHQPAFPGELPDEVFRSILRGVPKPMVDYVPDIDPRLVALVEQALEKDPDDRFDSIAAVQRELTAIRLNPQGSQSPAPPPVRHAPIPASPDPARLRAHQIEGHLVAARHAFDAGDYQAAIESCKQVLMLDASDERALAQLDRIHQTIDARQEAVRAAIERAQAAFDSGNLLSALRDGRQALVLEPGNEEALALVAAAETAIRQRQEEARIRAEEERRIEAERLEEQRRLEAERLEEQRRLEAERLEQQRRLEAERLEQQRRVNALLADARAALKGDQLDEAAAVLDRVREIDPAAAGVTDLAERLSRAVAAKEAAAARAREAEAKLDAAATCLQHEDLAGASTLLKEATLLAPEHPRATELASQLREAQRIKAAAEAAERLRRQVEELLQGAARTLASAGSDPAELAPALRDVKYALELDPENAAAPALKLAIDEGIASRREAARVRAAIENARRRFANGKHQAAIKLLEDFPAPAHAEIADALGELRAKLLEIEEQRRLERERIERQQRAAALVTDARAALRDHQFDAALAALAEAEAVDASLPELAQVRDQIREEQSAAERRAELERVLAALNERITAGELAEASELVNAAAALSATEPRVTAARRRVEQAIAAREAAAARAREVEEQHAAAAAMFAQGNLQGALQLVTRIAKLDPEHAPTAQLTAQVTDAIRRQQEAEAAERLRQTVDELLAGAETALQQPDRQLPDVQAATKRIAEAIALAPDDDRAKELKQRADDAIAVLREEARIETAIRNARHRFANGKHQAALQLLESLDAAAHPSVAEALRELRTLYDGIQELRRAEQEAAEKAKSEALAAERTSADNEMTVFLPPVRDEAGGPSDDERAASEPAEDESPGRPWLAIAGAVILSASMLGAIWILLSW